MTQNRQEMQLAWEDVQIVNWRGCRADSRESLGLWQCCIVTGRNANEGAQEQLMETRSLSDVTKNTAELKLVSKEED